MQLSHEQIKALITDASPAQIALERANSLRTLALDERDRETHLSGLEAHRQEVPYHWPLAVPVLPVPAYKPTESEIEAQAWIEARKAVKVTRRGRRVLRVYSLA